MHRLLTLVAVALGVLWLTASEAVARAPLPDDEGPSVMAKKKKHHRDGGTRDDEEREEDFSASPPGSF